MIIFAHRNISSMEITSNILQKYLEENSEQEPALLQELNRETHLRVLQPRMLSGHYQGRVLSLLSKLIRPKTVLEIGTFTGYATLCLAEGLRQDGVLHTIDVNEELCEMQRKYFDRSGKGSQIVQHLGEAQQIIPTIAERWDLVFIDADKRNYPLYFDLIIERMNPGGVILSDNVLWSGKVLEEMPKNDKKTQIILEYNRKLQQDPRVETVVLPIRDGLTISRVR